MKRRHVQLGRKRGESIVIGDSKVTVNHIGQKNVRLDVECADDVLLLRGEQSPRGPFYLRRVTETIADDGNEYEFLRWAAQDCELLDAMWRVLDHKGRVVYRYRGAPDDEPQAKETSK